MKTLLLAVQALLITLVVTASYAEPYPSRQIQIVTPGGAGGSLDVLIRLLSERMSTKLGQPIIILNKPGAGGTIALNQVARAQPDGYTFVFTQAGAVTLSPTLNKMKNFNVLEQLQPVTQVCTLAIALSANSSVPVKNLQELVALAKAKPQPISYATAGNQNSLTYIYSVLFANEADIKLMFVPYKSTPQGLTDLAAGQIDLMFDAVTSQYPEIQSKRIRPLAIFSKTRSALLPDVPTTTEQGFDITQGEGWYGLLAPIGTPMEIVNKVNSIIFDTLKEPDIQARIRQLDMNISALPPEEFKAVIAADVSRWTKVIQENNIAKGD